MISALRQEHFFATDIRPHQAHSLYLSLAAGPDDIRAAQRLRHRVFIEEMGALLDGNEHGVGSDHFDPYCQHLLVRDAAADNLVVGCYRILTHTQAARAGGYYSETEFGLGEIFNLPGSFMEVGRTCVHPDYRNGATIALLWRGLARFMVKNRFDHLIGCASIPLNSGVSFIMDLYRTLACTHLTRPGLRTYPRLPLLGLQPGTPLKPVEIPALLNAYLRMGARVCGEPAWDPQFNVADFFLLLSVDQLHPRYSRHFVEQQDVAA